MRDFYTSIMTTIIIVANSLANEGCDKNKSFLSATRSGHRDTTLPVLVLLVMVVTTWAPLPTPKTTTEP